MPRPLPNETLYEFIDRTIMHQRSRKPWDEPWLGFMEASYARAVFRPMPPPPHPLVEAAVRMMHETPFTPPKAQQKK